MPHAIDPGNLEQGPPFTRLGAKYSRLYGMLTLLALQQQSPVRGKPLKFQVVCPQIGTAVLKGLRIGQNLWIDPAGIIIAYFGSIYVDVNRLYLCLRVSPFALQQQLVTVVVVGTSCYPRPCFGTLDKFIVVGALCLGSACERRAF